MEIEAYPCSRLVSAMEEELLDPAPIWTNLKTFPFREFRGCVDILSGGFPCTPFSTAGQRKSTEDPRHLFPYILEGIRECRPAIVFLENVEGILSSETGTGENVLKYVLGSLESVGYRSTAGIFSASECLDGSGRGAPHQRKRVFILGYAKHNGLSAIKKFRGNETASDERRKEESQAAWESAGTSRSFDVPSVQGGSVGSKQPAGEQELGNKRLANTNSDRGSAGIPKKGYNKEGVQGYAIADHSGSRPLWPSRPGEPQFAWEEPRVVGDSTSKGLQEREESEQQQPVSSTEHSDREHPRVVGDSKSVYGEGVEQKPGRSGSAQEEDRRHGRSENEWEAQPELGRTVDGVASGVDSVTGSVDAVANRVDRLRLLGNGVVPATSERAFLVLWNRLISQD